MVMSTLAFVSAVPSAPAFAARSAMSAVYRPPSRPAISVPSLGERLRTQDELFAAQYRDDLRASPESKTAIGDYSENGKLDDYSLSASARQNAVDRAYLAKIRTISPEAFPEQDLISHQLFIDMLEKRVTDYELKNQEMPVTQMNGVQNSMADLPNAVPLDSVQQYEEYIGRLHQIPRVFQQTIDVLRTGEKDGLMPPRVLLEQVPAQCQGVISANPFLEPTKRFPAVVSAADRKRLTAEITQTVSTEVMPAYRNFARFISKDYAPHGRTSIGISGLPDGARRYQQAIKEQTSTDMTAAEIHALGLSEVERITGLLTQLAHKEGYADLRSFRAALNSDPRYIPKSASQIVDDFRKYVTQMQPKLHELFNNYPTQPVLVEAVPASQPGNATHFIAGAPDGSRPARIVVATSHFAQRRLLTDETIAYHEGIPGHLLQISIEEQLKGLPKFRQQLSSAGYAEGWAVYAEALGKEIGFFQDPGSDYGRLNTELLRAVRLVVDTGIHAQGWSRDQAIAYLRQSGAADEPMIQAEVDRYIAWPAQGLSYKVGQLKFLQLRHRAEQRLGSRFDIRAFHEEVLSAGNLPLNLLELRVNTWLGTQ